MKKICNAFTKIILVLFIGIFIWTIANVVLDYEKIIYEFDVIKLIFAILIYMILVLILYKKILPKIENFKKIPIILIGIFSVICLVVSYNVRVKPGWDMGYLYNIAKNYVKTGGISSTYLYAYPHNILLTLIFIVVFKIISFIPNIDYLVVVTIFNSLVVIATVIFAYLVTYKMLGKRKALLFLIIALFTTPLYLHAAIYYSDAISALFATMILYFYLKIIEKKEFKKKIIYQIFLGIALFIGVKIKVTSSFILIAIIVYNSLNLRIKEIIKDISISIPVFLILLGCFNIFINLKVIDDKDLVNQKKFPMVHYIMMGLKGKGGYDASDKLYTEGKSTYQEKKEADIEEIKKRLNVYNSNSFIKHLNMKQMYTWSDGTYFSVAKLNLDPVKKGIVHKIIRGDYSNIYKYIPQAMHISMLIFIVINAIDILKNKKYNSKDMILLIAMFGITIFLLIWETRSRYLVTLLPVMLILQINGIEILANREEKKMIDK